MREEHERNSSAQAQIRNPNIEIRNKRWAFKIQSQSAIQNIGQLVFNFHPFGSFEFVSDFELRI